MAAEVPGWCKQCGATLTHDARPQGRAKEFCGATCRQRFGRTQRLRRELEKEVGLTEKQIGRLLARFNVSVRT